MQNICSPGHPRHPGHPWGQEPYSLKIGYCTYMLRCPTSHLLLRLECKTYAALQKQKCNEQRTWKGVQVPAIFFAILYDTRYCCRLKLWCHNFSVFCARFFHQKKLVLIFTLFHVCSKVIFLFTEDQSRTQMLHKYRSANVHFKFCFFSNTYWTWFLELKFSF